MEDIIWSDITISKSIYVTKELSGLPHFSSMFVSTGLLKATASSRPLLALPHYTERAGRFVLGLHAILTFVGISVRSQ